MLELLAISFLCSIPVAILGAVYFRFMVKEDKPQVFNMKDGIIIFPPKGK